jgi:CubicO group peptidase (beta-lactamase class C family)
MASGPVARSESFTVFIPELERLIAEVMEEWRVPGLAVAVVQNGEAAFVRPYGLRDVEAGLKVTADTQFQLMSVSKPFTATGLAPFGGRAAHGLEEAGAGIHPGIPAA